MGQAVKSPAVGLVQEDAEISRPLSTEQAFGELKLAGEGEDVCAAGATLLRMQWESGAAAMPSRLIALDGIDVLKTMVIGSESLEIGAGVTLGTLERSEALRLACPMLWQAVRVIAAPSIRNMATLGGNVAWLIGDTLPALLAADAAITVRDLAGHRTLPLEQWLAARQERPAETSPVLIERILLPHAKQRPALAFFQKIGRRETFIPALASIAGAAGLTPDGRLAGVRFAAGGGMTAVVRLREAEQAAEGRTPAEAVHAVYAAVLDTFRPAGDVFASADYRKRVAANAAAAELMRLAQ